MKRYTEFRNYDNEGNVLDGTIESHSGEYIMVDDLLAWLDAEIALCLEGLDQASKEDDFDAKIQMEAMCATYRAVKAHIEG